MVDKLISKLRYMGKQYATGMESRGGGLHKHYLEEAADELESLRAEVETLRRERDELLIRCGIAEQELVALRQRIADAPVVAWLHTQSNGCSSLIRTPPSAFDPQDLADAEVSIYALISKEDLK